MVCGRHGYLPFAEAHAVAAVLGLASAKEWSTWHRKEPRKPGVPPRPDRTYKGGGWQGWGHWLGTGNSSHPGKHFLPFAEAQAAAAALGLASAKEWRAWCSEGARPAAVPSCPERTYKGGGWQGWGHWLGTGNSSHPGKPAPKHFLPFAEAQAAAAALGLASAKEWRAWCSEGARPVAMPPFPQVTYKGGGWQGWGHWLNTKQTR